MNTKIVVFYLGLMALSMPLVYGMDSRRLPEQLGNTPGPQIEEMHDDGSTTPLSPPAQPAPTIVPAQQPQGPGPGVAYVAGVHDGKQYGVYADMSHNMKVLNATVDQAMNKVEESVNKLHANLPKVTEATTVLGKALSDVATEFVQKNTEKIAPIIEAGKAAAKETIKETFDGIERLKTLTPEQVATLKSTPEGTKFLEGAIDLQKSAIGALNTFTALGTKILGETEGSFISALPAIDAFLALPSADDKQAIVNSVLTCAQKLLEKPGTTQISQSFITTLNTVTEQFTQDKPIAAEQYSLLLNGLKQSEIPQPAPATNAVQPTPLMIGWREGQGEATKKAATKEEIINATKNIKAALDPASAPIQKSSNFLFTVGKPFLIFAGCTTVVGILLLGKKAYTKWKKKKDKQQKQKKMRAAAARKVQLKTQQA